MLAQIESGKEHLRWDMGTCKYCGKKTRLFQDHHEECQKEDERLRALRKQGWRMMVSTARSVAQGEFPLGTLDGQLKDLARSHGIAESKARDAMIEGWEDALARFLDDNILSEDEESHLANFSEHFDLGYDELNAHGASGRAAMAATLRDVLAGKPSLRCSLTCHTMKNERNVRMKVDIPA